MANIAMRRLDRDMAARFIVRLNHLQAWHFAFAWITAVSISPATEADGFEDKSALSFFLCVLSIMLQSEGSVHDRAWCENVLRF